MLLAIANKINTLYENLHIVLGVTV